MSTPAHNLQLSAEEYLKFEEESDVRHEFVSGRIFAMAGATEAHDTIVVNLTILIGSKIKGSGCRLFSSDMKVKVKSVESYYYPDLMVSCEPYSAKSVYKEAPCLVVEVLSPSTRDIDLREKLLAYKTLVSLKEYLIVYQEERRAELYRRSLDDDWTVSVHQSADSLRLSPAPGLEIEIPIQDIYDGVIGVA